MIIRTVDRDGNRLINKGLVVIDNPRCIALGDGLALLQGLGRGGVVVQGVGPYPTG